MVCVHEKIHTVCLTINLLTKWMEQNRSLFEAVSGYVIIFEQFSKIDQNKNAINIPICDSQYLVQN